MRAFILEGRVGVVAEALLRKGLKGGCSVLKALGLGPVSMKDPAYHTIRVYRNSSCSSNGARRSPILHTCVRHEKVGDDLGGCSARTHKKDPV